MRQLRLLTLDPGHPDAARLHGPAADGVHPRGHVYAPFGPDLLAFLATVPPRWGLDVRAGRDWRPRGLREQPGNVAVVAGRAAGKLGLLLDCVKAGLHLLADGPWAVTDADLPVLDELYREADLRELVVQPLWPLRYDPAVRLLLDLATDPDVCGGLPVGTADRPTVTLDLTRHLCATVNGRPTTRPAWMFDPAQAGDALLAATPLADLALAVCSPGRPPHPERDVAEVDGTGWPGLLERDQFAAVTGLADFPPELAGAVAGDTLSYPANGAVTARLNGTAVRLSVLGEVDPPAGGGDLLEVVVGGNRAVLAARCGAGPGEVTVRPTEAAGGVYAALVRRCQGWQDRLPGLSVVDAGGQFRLAVPAADGGAFAGLLADFGRYFASPRQAPEWDRGAVRTAARLTVLASQSARRKQV